MHAKRAMPLSLRVASIYAMLVAATLLVAAGFALQFTRNQLSSQVDNQLNGLAKSFQDRVTKGVEQDAAAGTPIPTSVMNQTYNWLQNTSFPDSVGAVVALGSIKAPRLFRPSGSFDLGHELQPVLSAVLSVPKARWLNLKGRTRQAIRVLRVPITDSRGNVAGILVVGATQSKVVNHAVWNLLKGIGAASAIGLVFATALGLVAVRRTLRPLEEMSHERVQYDPRNNDRIHPEADADTAASFLAADKVDRCTQWQCVNEDRADDGGDANRQGNE